MWYDAQNAEMGLYLIVYKYNCNIKQGSQACRKQGRSLARTLPLKRTSSTENQYCPPTIPLVPCVGLLRSIKHTFFICLHFKTLNYGLTPYKDFPDFYAGKRRSFSELEPYCEHFERIVHKRTALTQYWDFKTRHQHGRKGDLNRTRAETSLTS